MPRKICFRAIPDRDDLEDLMIYPGERLLLWNGDIIEAVEVDEDKFIPGQCVYNGGQRCYFDLDKESKEYGCPVNCCPGEGEVEELDLFFKEVNDEDLSKIIPAYKILTDPDRKQPNR